jgi:hypothetical protein
MSLKRIAKDYGLELICLTKKNYKKILKQYNDINTSDIKNNAFFLEDDDLIILGIYNNPLYKKAAFFHEIGHYLIDKKFEKLVNNDMLLIEYEAWIQGLNVAKKYGVTFSDKAFKYILKSLHSYYKDSINVYIKNKK